jgi:hypothetical protein
MEREEALTESKTGEEIDEMMHVLVSTLVKQASKSSSTSSAA